MKKGRKNSMAEFKINDTGNRVISESGMSRSSTEGRPRYDLIWKPGLKRLAEHMGKGVKIHGERNWEKASTEAELARFKESANRHFEQWMMDENEEDHVAAVIFNMFGVEMVREKLKEK
jgi:hypothetical protein